MQINIKNLPKSEIEAEITLTFDEFEPYIKKAVLELSKSVEIQGFRPGKAPYEIIEKQVGSPKIYDEAAHLAIEKTWAKVVQEKNLAVIGKVEADVLKLAPKNDFIFKIKAALLPQVNLPDWRKIAHNFAKSGHKSVEVKAEELKDSINWLLKSRSQQIAASRSARLGDLVEIDFDAFNQGKPIENGSSRNHPVVIGDNKFISGFEDALTGLKVGEEKNFSIIVPVDYYQKQIAGKTLDFKVKVNNVFEIKKPIFDDNFAKSLGQFNNKEELENSIKAGLLQEKELQEKDRFRTTLIKKIGDESKVEIPDILINKEIEKMIEEIKANLNQTGLDFEKYLENLKTNEADFQEKIKPQAQARIKAALVLGAIGKELKISVSEEEIKAEEDKYLKNSSIKAAREVDPKELMWYIEGALRNEKIFKLLENIL